MRLTILVFALALATPLDLQAAGRRTRWRYSEPSPSAYVYPALPTETVTDGNGFGAELLALHNAERARAGLTPLELDSGLVSEAQAAAMEQARRGQLGHWLPIFGGSENAACGQCSEREAHADWMASSGHRRNVLGPWSRVGFARVGSFWTARYR